MWSERHTQTSLLFPSSSISMSQSITTEILEPPLIVYKGKDDVVVDEIKEEIKEEKKERKKDAKKDAKNVDTHNVKKEGQQKEGSSTSLPELLRKVDEVQVQTLQMPKSDCPKQNIVKEEDLEEVSEKKSRCTVQ